MAAVVVGILLACLTLPGLASPPASVVLLDFKDDAQLGQLRVSDQTKIEQAGEDHEGQARRQDCVCAGS